MAQSSIPKFKRQRTSSSFPRRLAAAALKFVLAVLLLSVLWVGIYRFIDPPITATMLGDMVAGRGARRQWLPLTSIDHDMVRAAIAAEDSKFCNHSGFDYDAIEAALQRNASGGRIRGGSTISQQTAKNVFLWQGGGYPRKAVEAWFTFLIEHLWGKRRIMEIYLNVAETGIGTYGVNAGSQRYYGHDASAMSATEAARIAAILPLPKERGAISPKGFTRRYGNSIAARLAVVARDRLDACVYTGTGPPPARTPPPSRKPVAAPGSDYENAAPVPAPASVTRALPPASEPLPPEPSADIDGSPAPDSGASPASLPPPTDANAN